MEDGQVLLQSVAQGATMNLPILLESLFSKANDSQHTSVLATSLAREANESASMMIDALDRQIESNRDKAKRARGKFLWCEHCDTLKVAAGQKCPSCGKRSGKNREKIRDTRKKD